MNILLVYPKYPDTYWSFRHALRFISKKAAVPPLGLITVSAMLPTTWTRRLVDMNVSELLPSDLGWADYIFISAMYVQKDSVQQILNTCADFPAKIVAGGPLFTKEYESFPQVDHFILNEAEITLPLFLADLGTLDGPARVYQTTEYADMSLSPVPEFHLLSVKDYASMNLQVARGCPYSCDFCEISSLLGHKVRSKSPEQITLELDALYKTNWRGPISIVDDNFIGNPAFLKRKLLPAINRWMKAHRYPFIFNTQTSINLADDEQLMQQMTETGFRSTFIGIETPDDTTLQECNKFQNEHRDMLSSVKKIQQSGLYVSAGFIVGFDSDEPSIFQRQINFIQQSGIVSAMVGLLNAPKNTKLHQQMKEENRLTTMSSGSNTDFSMNFIPRMNKDELLEGYRNILKNIYAEKPYYKRVRKLLLTYRRPPAKSRRIEIGYIKGFLRSVIIMGIAGRGRLQYWKLLIWTLFHRPAGFIDVITYTVYGYHFRMIFGIGK
jgi:radical SAM superfamily enzyme YgiQ (UPF0313 family)